MRAAAIALIVTLGIAAPSRAQAPAAPPPTDAVLAAKLTSAAEIADQNRRSNALNVEVNRKNREVQVRNDAKRAAYDKATADYQAQLAAQAAANAKVKADYDKSVEAWKADVAACKAGDAKRCGPASDAKTAVKPPSGKPAQP